MLSAAARRIVGRSTAGARSFWRSSVCLQDARSEELKASLVVDTLQLTKNFEQCGIPRDAAERLAMQITELIVTNKVRMESQFVSVSSMEKVSLQQESKTLQFRTELMKSQDMAQSTVLKELDRQQSFLEKTRTELRHEIDKMSSSQRLDWNLEKGRMRDDLQLMRDKTTELEIRVDRDINELKSSLERGKNDTIKSVITIIGTFSAIAFTISRFVAMGSGAG